MTHEASPHEFRVYDRLYNKVYSPIQNEKGEVIEFLSMAQWGSLIIHTKTENGWENSLLNQLVISENSQTPVGRFIVDKPTDVLPKYHKLSYQIYVEPVIIEE